MFYSHKVLARKGPLATVWMAAHLENKIRKTLVRNTDISYSIRTIMYPEAPIALRLSGHLLLGVVRIYSKKVDYLFQDCNDLAAQIRMLFAPAPIDLPEDANKATYQSVTLPEAFNLDAFELDNGALHLSMLQNDHVKPVDEITLQNQVLNEGVTYIHINLNEDSTDSSSFSGRFKVGVGQMEEDIIPGFQIEVASEIFRELSTDFGIVNHSTRSPVSRSVPIVDGSQKLDGLVDVDISPEEAMRAATHAVEDKPHDTIIGLDGGKPNMDVNMEDDDVRMLDFSPTNDPPLESMNDPLLEYPPLLNAQNLTSSTDPDADAIPVCNNASIAEPIPEFELPPSPPARRRNVKKRVQFEEKIVLTNAEMKKRLRNANNLLCKRRKLPCSSLDLWKLQCRLQGEKIFEVSLLSGMTKELLETCQERCFAPVADNIQLNASIERPRFNGFIKESFLEIVGTASSSSQSEQLPNSGKNMNGNMFETGVAVDHASTTVQLRPDEHSERHLSKERPSPSQMDATSVCPTDQSLDSPIQRTLESTPVCPTDRSLDSPIQRTLESNIPGTSGTHYVESGMLSVEAPQVDYGGHVRSCNHLPEIHSLSRSPISNDLNFLEEESTSEGSVMNTTNISARTRAVARYFTEQSPEPLLPNESGDLSLNKILGGRRRKHCVKMFFETLVLKSCDYIKVHQEEAYGDVTISLAPALSKMLS